MEPLVVSYAAFVIALASLCLTLWRTRRSYNDSDVEELAEQVGRLARRARADTMRRVRAEAKGLPPDGAPDVEPPPELRPAAPATTSKSELRRKLLSDVTHGWRH